MNSRAEKKHSLSLSMIVKDEEKHLPRVLENAHIFCDEIVIADTGSADRSVEIARSFHAKVIHFEWCDDFARARNASLEQCSGDFVMWLDADDLVFVEDARALRQLFCRPIDWDVLYLPYYYNYHPRKPGQGKRKKPPRIFRNDIGVKWVAPIHEHLSYPPGIRKNNTIDNIVVYHSPLRTSDSNALRNLRIMFRAAGQPENRGDDYFYWHIAKEYSGLGNTREAVRYFKKSLQLCGPEQHLRRARQYYALARNYGRSGHHTAALEYYGRCALAYGRWREPYFGMGESLARLGDFAGAASCLRIAATISRHQGHVERAELYESSIVEQKIGDFQDAARQKAAAGIPAEQGDERHQTVIAGGDLCLGRQLPGYVSTRGAGWPFAGVEDILNRGDMLLANLECVISNTGSLFDKGGRRPFHYRGHPMVINTLADKGFTVVTTANNHAMDYGVEALLEQNEMLDYCHIAHPGSGRTLEEAALPAFIQAGDIVVAVLSIDIESSSNFFQEGRGGVNCCSSHDEAVKRLAAGIACARRYAHLVIVSPHWGKNWQENPSGETRVLARSIIDLGADAILGHSAHILQGIEIYRDRPIIYDMGSILFDRVLQNRLRFSALFELQCTARQFTELIIHPVRLHQGRAVKADRDRQYIKELVAGLTRDLDGSIEFVDSGDGLRLALPRTEKAFAPERNPQPEEIYVKERVRAPSKHYLQRPKACIVSGVPRDIHMKKTVAMSHGVTFLGAHSWREVRPGRGFVVRTYFMVEAPMKGRWEGRIIARDGEGREAFSYTHPVSEGAVPPRTWPPGQVIVDETVVRPPLDVPAGKYSLLWILVERDSKEAAMPEPQAPPDVEGAYIGDILITPEAPPGVAGLAWS